MKPLSGRRDLNFDHAPSLWTYIRGNLLHRCNSVLEISPACAHDRINNVGRVNSGTTMSTARWRDNQSPDPVSPSLSPAPLIPGQRPKSAILTSPSNGIVKNSHGRTQSFSPLGAPSLATQPVTRKRSLSYRGSHQSSSTFAPMFIKTEELRKDRESIRGIEGENDFSGKRYVWLRDPECAFVKGSVVGEVENGRLLIQTEDGNVRWMESSFFLGTDERLSGARTPGGQR